MRKAHEGELLDPGDAQINFLKQELLIYPVAPGVFFEPGAATTGRDWKAVQQFSQSSHFSNQEKFFYTALHSLEQYDIFFLYPFHYYNPYRFSNHPEQKRVPQCAACTCPLYKAPHPALQ